jgi:hypothetical protein
MSASLAPCIDLDGRARNETLVLTTWPRSIWTKVVLSAMASWVADAVPADVFPDVLT